MITCAVPASRDCMRFINANKAYRKSGWSSRRTAGKNGPTSLNLFF
jgi:hypothetical protein